MFKFCRCIICKISAGEVDFEVCVGKSDENYAFESHSYCEKISRVNAETPSMYRVAFLEVLNFKMKYNTLKSW